jgi:general secretion pathway protein C
MDLAKNFAQWRDRSPEQWITQANRLLPPMVVGVLVLLIAFNLADLTWRLLESPLVDGVAPPSAAVSAGVPDAERYQALSSWQPFGQAPDESTAAISADLLLDAPDTTLNLTLVGTVQASELPERGSMVIPEQGAAVISGGAGQQVYWTGDQIEGAGNAALHSVFNDRVLLDRGARRLETLRFPESLQDQSQGSRIAARPQVRSVAPVRGAGSSAPLPAALGEVAELLSEHIQFAMHTENGRVLGFRVQPRGDPRVFSELGLEAGDVLTEVNGMRLNDLRNASQVLQALGETQMANVMIRRDGVDRALVLNLDQIERLAESLQ